LKTLLLYHMIAFLAGFLLDLIWGDPYWMPHPIRLIGNLIGALDKRMMGDVPKRISGSEIPADSKERYAKKEHKKGVCLVWAVVLSTLAVSAAVIVVAYLIHPIAGVIVEGILTYYILATKCLKTESMKVYRELEKQDLEGARYAVSMIVGRDTESLDEIGVAKAAIETVAENTSDGVIAPMLYTAIGGPILGFVYKAINTMDSMVGYKNHRYRDFGTAAAKLDDVVNFLPARISAWLIIISCVFLGRDYSAKNAHRIFKRDRYNHKSPNSAQTESASAGALGIQLAGPAVYFGELCDKPTIGDATRPVEPADIKRVNRLLYGAAVLSELICLIVMAGIHFLTV